MDRGKDESTTRPLMLHVGSRVERGKDWTYNRNEDGGKGGLGTVIEMDDAKGYARVEWDRGIESLYRHGFMNKYDLQVVEVQLQPERDTSKATPTGTQTARKRGTPRKEVSSSVADGVTDPENGSQGVACTSAEPLQPPMRKRRATENTVMGSVVNEVKAPETINQQVAEASERPEEETYAAALAQMLKQVSPPARRALCFAKLSTVVASFVQKN